PLASIAYLLSSHRMPSLNSQIYTLSLHDALPIYRSTTNSGNNIAHSHKKTTIYIFPIHIHQIPFTLLLKITFFIILEIVADRYFNKIKLTNYSHPLLKIRQSQCNY